MSEACLVDKNEKIQNLFEELETSEDKEKIYKEIYDLTENSFILLINYLKNPVIRSKEDINKNIRSREEEEKDLENRYECLENKEGKDSSYIGLFDYRDWSVLGNNNSEKLFQIGQRLEHYIKNYPVINDYSNQPEYIEINLDSKYSIYVDLYHDWLRYQKLDLFRLVQLNDVYEDGANLNLFGKSETEEEKLIAEIIFKTNFRDYEYQSLWSIYDYWTDSRRFERVFETFWKIDNLQFEIKEDFCLINSIYGEIKLKISSFINIFLSPYNDNTYAPPQYHSYFDFRALGTEGYGPHFEKNILSFCKALDAHKKVHGYFYGIDRETIYESLLPLFRLDSPGVPISYELQELINSNKYPALVELVYIGLLTHPLYLRERHDVINVFTKTSYEDSDEGDDDYMNWTMHTFQQLRSIKCYAISDIYMLLGTINLAWHDKMKSDRWPELINIINNDHYPRDQREILFDFIYNNFPSNTNQNCLYFESHFQDLINDKSDIFLNEKETLDEAFNYTRNMDLTDYSKNKIEQHFKFIAFSQNARDYRDNITLPLFKAVENEIFNFLKNKGLIQNDKSRNTDFGGMLIQLREYVRDKVIDDDLRKDWNKVKREAFQLTEIRNKSAHASIMMADEVIRAQNGVKNLLEWFSKFKLKFI